MLAFVIAVMVVAGRAAGSTWRLLALAFAVWAIADTIYLYQAALGTYEDYTLLDTAWPPAYVLVALAALPPGRAARRAPPAPRHARPARRVTLVALGLLVFDHYSRLNLAALWLATRRVAAAVVRFALTFRENLRSLDASEAEAATDPLTGLGNRRALMRDLDERSRRQPSARRCSRSSTSTASRTTTTPSATRPATRCSPGSARTSRRARRDAAPRYRMGGDEFCVLTRDDDPTLLERAAPRAAANRRSASTIGCSHGIGELPTGEDPVDALRIADQRMYANKRRGRRASDEAVHQVLLRVAAEHDGELRDHVDDVADLAEAVGRELGLDAPQLSRSAAPPRCTTSARSRSPTRSCTPRAARPSEWEYMRQHTLIGERIIAAAPELAGVAGIVRSSHERFDGGGYPDGLAGEEIPLGARIVAVCDAYDAIVTDRAYRRAASREALAELQRCAGTQFDPRVVAAFMLALEREATASV